MVFLRLPTRMHNAVQSVKSIWFCQVVLTNFGIMFPDSCLMGFIGTIFEGSDAKQATLLFLSLAIHA
jgi:hypothetical protein